MKKFVLLLLLATSPSLVTVLAKPVEPTTARAVAARYFTNAVDITPEGWTELYVFAPSEGNGFVVVSADDCTRPVLAYSYTRPFATPMPAHIADWYDGYRQEIASLREAGATASPEVARMWTMGAKEVTDSLPPLLTTTWNQRPLYNNLCPWSEEDSSLVVAGCVATAQTQVMKYWNHPAQGHGSFGYYHPQFGYLSANFDTAYMWDYMPDALNSLSSDSEIYAVAQLTYHVGVAVGMDYGVSASGASVFSYGYSNYASTELSLKTYFGYSPMLYMVQKPSYTDSQWDAIMLNELQHDRPIIYTGRDPAGGHAFVVDGYSADSDSNTGNRFFHINWGWGGHNDGYYTLDSLSPGSGGAGGNATYTFNENNAALVGIVPIAPSPDGSSVVDMYADPQQGFIEGNGTYVTYEDMVTVVAKANDDYRFLGWQSGSLQNPVTFTPSGNLTDTAVYAAVGGDTIGYCDDNLYQSWRDDYGITTAWGIRILPQLRNKSRALSAVQVYQYVSDNGYVYSLNVYIGSAIGESEPVYSKDLYAMESGWVTIELDSALYLRDNDTLWITFSQSSQEVIYPATHSRYSGNSDASWYLLPQGWAQYDHEGVYATWMIRGIFAERQCTVSAERMPGSLCDMDLVYGTGLYNVGDTAVVGINDEFFVNWENEGLGDDNPVSFVVSTDTVLYPYCRCAGIDPVTGNELRAIVVGNTVIASADAVLYDAVGRRIGSGRRIEAPAKGVYILCFGHASVRIVIF